jgi:hypothetical protein
MTLIRHSIPPSDALEHLNLRLFGANLALRAAKIKRRKRFEKTLDR